MSDAAWVSLKDIFIIVAGMASTYYSYKATHIGERNSRHLKTQDGALSDLKDGQDECNLKVDGQMTALRQAGVVARDKAAIAAIVARAGTDRTAAAALIGTNRTKAELERQIDDLKSEVARMSQDSIPVHDPSPVPPYIAKPDP